MSHPIRSITLVAVGLLVAGTARALPTWSLELAPSTSWDRPSFTFTNTSTAGEQITDLSIAIGDTSYHFDAVGAPDPSEALTGASLLSPDRVQNNWWAAGGRSNTLAWSFGDFDAGEAFTFTVDLDLDIALFGSTTDARSVLFNNDFPFGDPNAVVSATFSDGSVAALTLPDGPFAGSYGFSSDGTAGGHHVPEAQASWLLGVGLVGLAWIGAPRRRVAA